MSIYDEKLVQMLKDAAEKSFKALLAEHSDEEFYYFTYVMAEDGPPFVSAWSYEALAGILKENGVTEEDTEDYMIYKWSYADSPYCAYGYEEFFQEVDECFSERLDALADASDEEYEREFEIRIASMEEAMRRLDAEGLFGTGEARNRVVILAEFAPPDASNTGRVQRLNPTVDLDEWTEWCAEPEE